MSTETGPAETGPVEPTPMPAQRKRGKRGKHFKMRRRRGGMRRFVMLVGLALLGAAVVQEMRRPALLRTWHGTLLIKVPYDLRPPTLERLVKSVWDPGNPRLFTDRPFGIGWSINLARLLPHR